MSETDSKSSIVPVDLQIACWTEDFTRGIEIHLWLSGKTVIDFTATIDGKQINASYSNELGSEARRYGRLLKEIARTGARNVVCSGSDHLVISFTGHLSVTQFAANARDLIDALEEFFGAMNSKIRFQDELPKDFPDKVKKLKGLEDELDRQISIEPDASEFVFKDADSTVEE